MLPESVDCRKNPWICRFILNIFLQDIVFGCHNILDIWCFVSKSLCFKGFGAKKGFDFMSNTQYNTGTFYV